jgi:hypothetical protein
MAKTKSVSKATKAKRPTKAKAAEAAIADHAEAQTPTVSTGASGTSLGDGLPGDANYLADVQRQYDWQLALTRMIAESWNDPKLRQQLIDGDAEQIRLLFLRKVNYALPNGVKVTFEAVDVRYIDNPKLNGWASGLDELSADVIIKLPPAPDPKFQAKAIADYVATGKAYPFT